MDLTPIKDILNLKKEAIISEAEGILADIETKWHKSKKFSYNLNDGNKVGVQTYDTHRKDVHWCARVSLFDKIDPVTQKAYFQKLYDFLGGSTYNLSETHSEFEKKYIHELESYRVWPHPLADDQQESSITYLAELIYKFPFPIQKRVFHELIHVSKDPVRRRLIIVSYAVDPSLFKDPPTNFVPAQYTSIESVTFDSDNNLKWQMCTCSNPGGLIPDWLSKISMPSAIAKDVPSFLNWAHSTKTDH